MYYGVEQSTDLRNQRTVIKKFTSIKSLYKWLDQCNNDYTYADPEGARNWHRTIREGYELCGHINKKDAIFHDRGHQLTLAMKMITWLHIFGNTESEYELPTI